MDKILNNFDEFVAENYNGNNLGSYGHKKGVVDWDDQETEKEKFLKKDIEESDDGKTKLKKSKYKGVYNVISGGKTTWVARKGISGKKWSKYCKTERSAALAYDKFLVSKGLEPVNILKQK